MGWVEGRRGAVLASALLVLIGCRRDRAQTTVVEFWAMGREGEMVQRLIPAFEQQHPGIRVRVQQIPWSAAHEKLLTAFVGEAMPDVFQLGNTWIPELEALDALEPLAQRMAGATGIAPLEDYFAGILDTNRIRARLVALPWYVDTRLLFYRTDLLHRAGYDQPPATWTAWRDALQRVQSQMAPGAHAMVLPLTEWQLPIVLALQGGAPLLRGDDEYGNFRAPATQQAFDLYLSFFRLGLTPQSAESQISNLYRDFANGDFACFVSGPWSIGELRTRLPPDFAERWSTAPMPSARADAVGVSIAGGASLAVFRGSSRKDAAWQWIAFLSQAEQQTEFYALTGDLPARTSAWRSAPLAADAALQAFWTQLQHVQATPKVPEWERIANKVGQYSEAMVRSPQSVNAALTALDQDVDAILAKRRWLLQQRARHHGSEAGA